MAMVKNSDKLSWYDVKTKKKFVPDNYRIEIRNGRRFGVAKNPKSGVECWRVLGNKK